MSTQHAYIAHAAIFGNVRLKDSPADNAAPGDQHYDLLQR